MLHWLFQQFSFKSVSWKPDLVCDVHHDLSDPGFEVLLLLSHSWTVHMSHICSSEVMCSTFVWSLTLILQLPHCQQCHKAPIISKFILCLLPILHWWMVCINLIWCAFSTDSQAAAGQAAGPGSPGGRRLSRKDSGDQARVRAAITSPAFTALAPWPIHLLTIYLQNFLHPLTFKDWVKTVKKYSLICCNTVCFSCPGSSRTKRLWVRSCRTLSMTLRRVIDRWLPGGLQPPSHINMQPSQRIDSTLLQLPSRTPWLHLSIPLLPHPARCCSLIPPRGRFTFSHSGSVCFYL